ncbi:uncharacterized protein LOC135820592 [Sycon ciliatum]|uniref:uncharacterized protein LOC135820592 n=1 Tax=Sycon ciliatum TaxID=27933 RepID=UPI0031F61632
MAVLQPSCTLMFVAVLATVMMLPFSYSQSPGHSSGLKPADAEFQTKAHCDHFKTTMLWWNSQCFCQPKWSLVGNCSQRRIPHGLQIVKQRTDYYDLKCDSGYAKDQPLKSYGTCRDQHNCTIFTDSSICTSLTHHGAFPVSIPNALKGKRHLQYLYFQRSSIEQLQGHSFGFSLSYLRVLHLEDNLLMSSSFSTGWASPMPNLHELYLDNNKLTFTQTDVTDPGARMFSGLGNLQKLSMNSNNLDYLPPNLFSSLTNLQELYMVNCSLQLWGMVQTHFTPLSKLHLLDMSYNHITSVPTPLNLVMPNLTEINLLGNSLSLDRICPLIFVQSVMAETAVVAHLDAQRIKNADFCPDHKLGCADLVATQEQRLVCTCGQKSRPASKSPYYARSCNGQCSFRKTERYCPILPMNWDAQTAPAGMKPLDASCPKGMKLVSGKCELMTGQCNVPSKQHTVYSYITWPTDNGEGLTASETASFCSIEKNMSAFTLPQTADCLAPLMSNITHSGMYDKTLRFWGEFTGSGRSNGLRALEYNPSTQRFAILQLPPTAKLDVICTAKWTISNLPAVGEIAMLQSENPMMNPSLAEELCRSLNGFSLISWDMLHKAWPLHYFLSRPLRSMLITQWLRSPTFRKHPRYYMSGTPSDYSVRQYWMEPKPNGHVIIHYIAGDDSLRISPADPSLMDRITGAPLCFKFNSYFLGLVKKVFGPRVFTPPTPPTK